jgi:hypothetical protein
MRLANVNMEIQKDFLAEAPIKASLIAFCSLHNQVARFPGQ